MKKHCLLTMTVFALLLSFQGCYYVAPDSSVYNGGGVRYEPPPIALVAPPDVIVMPFTADVYFAPDISIDLFFWNGWWWRPWEGRWYHSHDYNRGWVYYNGVPSFYSAVDPGWRRYYREHNWSGHRWDYERVPNQRLQQNWQRWQNDKHWEREKAWGVQGIRPGKQQPEARPERDYRQQQPVVQPGRDHKQQRPEVEPERGIRPQQPEAQPGRDYRQQQPVVQPGRDHKQQRPEVEPERGIRPQQPETQPGRDYRQQQPVGQPGRDHKQQRPEVEPERGTRQQQPEAQPGRDYRQQQPVVQPGRDHKQQRPEGEQSQGDGLNSQKSPKSREVQPQKGYGKEWDENHNR